MMSNNNTNHYIHKNNSIWISHISHYIDRFYRPNIIFWYYITQYLSCRNCSPTISIIKIVWKAGPFNGSFGEWHSRSHNWPYTGHTFPTNGESLTLPESRWRGPYRNWSRFRPQKLASIGTTSIQVLCP